MRQLLLYIGMGMALIGSACRARPDTPLTAAAAANDAEALRRLLADGFRPDEGGDALPALMWAARENATAAIAVLLEAGASVNARDQDNRWTPLLHAIHKRRLGAVRLLLERGADPNLGTPEGVTPLMMAADDPDPTIVSLLLGRKADPRAEGPGGRTPFTQAVSGGAMSDLTDRPILGGCHPATVRAFLSHDPTLRVPDTAAGRQAIWWARFHGCHDVLTQIGVAPAGPAHQAIAGVGILRDELGVRKRPDDLERRRATDDRPRR